MSLVAMSADSPRSSMFTFESTVHSCHVLRYLDDQRQRDMLCDITVVVEGQSFRAHRAVLASCSEYFTDRISSHTQHETVLSLPQKVTVAGFEPLLKFAYTSKLLFSKDNVLEIRNSASVLGFRDLDKACFDFLLPKFFSNNRGYAPFQKKKCCKAKCKRRLSKADGGINNDNILGNEKEVKPVSDSPSEEEVGWLRNQSVSSETGSNNSTPILPPVAHANGSNDYPLQCPKYRKFQLACGSGKTHNHPVAVIEDACSLSCLPCFSSGSRKDETEVEAPSQTFSNPDPQAKAEVVESFKRESCDIEKNTNETRDAVEREGKWHEKGGGVAAVTTGEQLGHIAGVSSSGSAAPLSDRLGGVRGARSGPSPVLGERSLGLIFHHCPLEAFSEGCASAGSVGQEEFVMGVKEDEKVEDCGEGQPVSVRLKAEDRVGRRGDMAGLESARSHGERETGGGGWSNAEREEEAEHLSNGLGSDVLSSSRLFRDADAGSSASDAGDKQSPPLNWLKLHANLGSGPAGCPFLQDLDPRKSPWKGGGEAGRSACGGGVSQSGKSPCVSSLNSGEDGDTETETEGDSETNTSESARQVQLPFSVDWIVDLSRNEFQQLLKQQSLTGEQLDFVHDMRRRSKNRIAARRCRKRKLDCIYNLECEINKLRTEREKLMAERSHLSQLKSNTWHSVSALCHRVCSEANLQPEQLQVLAKYTSPECPLASCIPQIDSLTADPGVPHQPEACSSGLRVNKASLKALSSSSSEIVTGDGQPSGDGKAL